MNHQKYIINILELNTGLYLDIGLRHTFYKFFDEQEWQETISSDPHEIGDHLKKIRNKRYRTSSDAKGYILRDINQIIKYNQR